MINSKKIKMSALGAVMGALNDAVIAVIALSALRTVMSAWNDAVSAVTASIVLNGGRMRTLSAVGIAGPTADADSAVSGVVSDSFLELAGLEVELGRLRR